MSKLGCTAMSKCWEAVEIWLRPLQMKGFSPTSWSLYACSQLLAFYDITIVNRKNPLGTLRKHPNMDGFIVVDP